MSANRAFLAFDFGERRIGVAIGNDLTETANPLTAIDAETDDARFAASRNQGVVRYQQLRRSSPSGELQVGVI